MRWFLRQSTVGREPLPVAMCGIRSGERALQIGIDDAAITGAIAAKPGLAGEAAIAVADETAAGRARDAASSAGALVEVRVYGDATLPFADGSFDVVVVHNRKGQIDSPGVDRARLLEECRRVLRAGGRAVVLDGVAPARGGGWLRPRAVPEAAAGGATTEALGAAGFRAVRTVAERDGYRFVEGMRP